MMSKYYMHDFSVPEYLPSCGGTFQRSPDSDNYICDKCKRIHSEEYLEEHSGQCWEAEEDPKIGIPLPKGHKLIVIVSDETSQKQVDEFGKYLNEFNQSDDAILMIKESLVKQIYLVEKAEMKKE